MGLRGRIAVAQLLVLALFSSALVVALPALVDRAVPAILAPILERQVEAIAAHIARRRASRPSQLLVGMRTVEEYVDGDIVLFDRTGRVVARAQVERSPAAVAAMPDPREIVALKRPRVFLLQQGDGTPVLLAVAPLRTGARSAAAAVGLYRPLPALHDVARRLSRLLALAGLGALVLGLLVSSFLTDSVVRRLREVQALAQALAEGDLSRRVPERGGDEIAELGQHINRMADRIQRLIEGLRHSEELRRAMLAAVSHELRTPVAVIRGLAEALRDGLFADGGQMRGQADIIASEAAQLGRLVDDLIQVACLEAGQLDVRLQRVACADWLREAVERLRPVAMGRHVELELVLDPGLMGQQVEADPDRLDQVLSNLVDNAVRHAPRGSRVTVRAERRGERVFVAVSDRGPGIDPDDLPRIFDPFYRGRNAARSRGAGLGLAIVRALVAAHGGEVGVDSRPGCGATFWFTLPLRLPAAPVVSEDPGKTATG